MSISKKILALPTNEIEELKSNCRNCLILGGTKTCTCLSLQSMAKKLNVRVEALLKWYKNYDKNFYKNFIKKA